MSKQNISNILSPPDTTGPYETDPTRWYKSYPYGFEFYDIKSTSGSTAKQTFWLPIAPNNINTTTHYATNIVTTLYGIVEEHSEVRYFDIVISGNTGIAPKYTTAFAPTADGSAPASAAQKVPGIQAPNPLNPGSPSIGRKSFEPGLNSQISGVLGGFLPEVSNTISAAANLISSISGGQSNPTGILPQQSGYYAFHNLYKFLLRYKEDAARVSASSTNIVGSVLSSSSQLIGGNRQTHPLKFLNYKDKIKYDVIPISFTLTRSAENPMLYNYTIRMRGFNLQDVNKSPQAEDLLNQLGLGGLSGSLFSSMTSVVGNANTLISGVAGVL